MHIYNKNDSFLRKMLKFGKVIKIDFSFFLIFAVAWCVDEVGLFFCYLIFSVLHEFVHFFIAKKLGYYPKKIHLTFFGASLEGYDDFGLQDEIKIVLSGPIFNLCVVVVCYLSFWFYPESYNFLYDILICNWSIFLFNFLPIYPLDFGRFLLALFTKTYNRKSALKRVKFISFIFLCSLFIMFLISLFFDYNFSLGFVCINLASLSMKSSRDTSYKRQLFVDKKFDKLKKGLIERTVYLKSDVKDFVFYKFIDDYHFVKFVLVDKNYKIVKTFNEIDFYRENGFI